MNWKKAAIIEGFALCVLCIINLALGIYYRERIVMKVMRDYPRIEYLTAKVFMPNRFWLHKTNSPEKQQEFHDKYKGIEFDIIYYPDKMGFENSHDKENYEKYNLENNLAAYKKIGKQRGIWFDFKNLTHENVNASKDALENLLQKYQIDKNLVIIESGNWQDLRIYKEAGFKTSYYFPYYDFSKLTRDEIEKAKDLTLEATSSGNVDYLSFDAKYYNFINNVKLPENIKLLTWIDTEPWYAVIIKKEYKKILQDKRVKVVLVKDLGHYNR